MVMNCNVPCHLQQCKCPDQDLWAPLYCELFTNVLRTGCEPKVNPIGTTTPFVSYMLRKYDCFRNSRSQAVRCSDFYGLDLVLIGCQLFLAVLLEASMLPGPMGCTHCGDVAVADEMHMIFECLALHALRQQYAPLFSTNTDTMRSFFAQQNHMQVFMFVLRCLDVLQI